MQAEDWTCCLSSISNVAPNTVLFQSSGCSGIPGSQPEPVGGLHECVGAWSSGEGWSGATPSFSAILPVQSESARVPLLPLPCSPVVWRNETGRVTFLSSSLSPHCYWEGWVNSFLISFPLVPIFHIKALSLPSLVLQLSWITSLSCMCLNISSKRIYSMALPGTEVRPTGL